MPNNYLYAFILSFLAGISTLIGAMFIYFDKHKSNKIITIALSFAAGVMICVSLTDLLPNSYNMMLVATATFKLSQLELIGI